LEATTKKVVIFFQEKSAHRLLKATSKKRKKVVNFVRKKVHPRQNPGYVYEGREISSTAFRPTLGERFSKIPKSNLRKMNEIRQYLGNPKYLT